MGFDLGCLKAVHFYITSDDLLSDCLNQLEASADLAVFWAAALRLTARQTSAIGSLRLPVPGAYLAQLGFVSTVLHGCQVVNADVPEVLSDDEGP